MRRDSHGPIFFLMKKFKLIFLCSLVAVVFLYFLKIEIWDADFWWHIATGRQIVTAGTLPDKDSLTFTSGMPENKNLYPVREKFILQQYWLAQVFFYLLFRQFGPAGIIVMRAFLFSLIILFVVLRLHRWSVSTTVAFLSGFSLFMMLLGRLTGDRPVLFTYLFTAIAFFILEEFRDKRDRRIFLLFPLMLLWANLHGGFIIGVLVIAVYMVCEGIMIAVKKAEYSRREVVLFYATAALAIGISFLNPCGWNAFAIAASGKYKAFVNGVQEYDSPYLAFFKERLSPVDYWYVVAAALFPVILFLRKKKFEMTHVILLSGFFIISLTALRFIFYYEVIAVMILGREIDAWLKDAFSARFSAGNYSKVMNWLAIAACISLLIFVSGSYGKNKPFKSFGIIAPEAGVNFVQENGLKGNILNDYSYGGYLAWKLYPREKPFIDTRGLNLGVMTEYSALVMTYNSFFGPEPSKTKGPLWERLLDHYNINTVFLGYGDIHGTVFPLIFRLTENEKWVPVYCDQMSVIFVRNSDQNDDIIEKFRVSPDYIYDAIIYKSAVLAMANKGNPRSLISLGETFYKMGRLKDSLTAYKYAMKRLPSPQVQDEIKKIETQLKVKEEKRGEA